MVTVRATPDCGNAPRKEVLRDFVIAMAEADGETLAGMVGEGVEWHLVGEAVLRGRAAVRAWAAGLPVAREITFGAVITHGREAGVDGTTEAADGRRYAFCHVLRFAGAARTAKIAEIRSYVLPGGEAEQM
ncbi:nuclear transport factor 2 family protein [Streptomyces xanthochromogenes]|uniref:nuclear transport factor 2 family protein n=1 Tax=Streptomyces xanthochromogenes TaxID=67384 RepID=UPI0034204987